MLQEFVDKLNDRYSDQGNCGVLALAAVTDRHYLSCKKAATANGWTESGITLQGLVRSLDDLGAQYEIRDGEGKALKTIAKTITGLAIVKTKDHFSVVSQGELINACGCERHKAQVIINVKS